jgi:hypothetical protein
MISQAQLITFNPATYTAVIKPDGSAQSYLEGVTVAKNIPAAEMLPGRSLAVLFFDRYRAAEAVIIAVW